MSQTKADVPLLAELSEEEREVAMVRYRVIAPLLAEEHPGKDRWREAAEQGECSCAVAHL